MTLKLKDLNCLPEKKDTDNCPRGNFQGNYMFNKAIDQCSEVVLEIDERKLCDFMCNEHAKATMAGCTVMDMSYLAKKIANELPKLLKRKI